MLQSSKKEQLKTKQVRPLMARSARAISWLAWVIVAFFAGAYLLSGAWWLLDWVGVPVDTLNESVASSIQAAALYLLALGVTVAVPYSVNKMPINLELFGLRRLLSWSDMGLSIVGFIPYLIFSAILTAVAAHFLPWFDVAQTQDVGFSAISDRVGYVLAFITLVIVAPFAEEALFRGVLFSKLRKLIGFIGTTVLVSLCFALLHGQWNVGIDVFALSVVLCSLREVTGSIWAGVLLHMLKNSIAYYFLFVSQML